jgi:hypothetical protein
LKIPIFFIIKESEMAEKGENVDGEEESWEYYDDNEVLPDFWQVRYNY